MKKTTSDQVPFRKRDVSENQIVLWLDKNADESDPEWRQTVEFLRQKNQKIYLFKKADPCVDFLSDLPKGGKRVSLILSSEFCPNIVPIVHDIPSLNDIYITGILNRKDRSSIKRFSKVRVRLRENRLILNRRTMSTSSRIQSRRPRTTDYQDIVSMSFATKKNAAGEKVASNQLEPSFMYSKLLKSALLTMKYDQRSVRDLMDYCRQNLEETGATEAILEEFEQNYNPDEAIEWYIRESFTYTTLNQALRSLDADLIVRMGFFINDLHRQIEKLHKEQIDQYKGKTFIVYRGQRLSPADFTKLNANIDGLIAFNCFLSTSWTKEFPFNLAESTVTESDMYGIFFILEIDPEIASANYAQVDHLSPFEDEHEVLFSMNTVFRIQKVTQSKTHDRLYEVHLTLVIEDDRRLRPLTDEFQSTLSNLTDIGGIAHLLIDIEKPDMVIPLCRRALEDTIEDTTKKYECHRYMGLAKLALHDHHGAKQCFKNAMSVLIEKFPDDNLCDNELESLTKLMEDLSTDSSFDPKICDILQKKLEDDFVLGIDGLRAGSAFDRDNDDDDDDEIFDSSQTTIVKQFKPAKTDEDTAKSDQQSHDDNAGEATIIQKLLASQETFPLVSKPNLATIYGNLGWLYEKTGQYKKALHALKRAIEFARSSLSPNNPYLGTIYVTLAQVYQRTGDLSQAKIYCEKSLEIRQISLPNDSRKLSDTIGKLADIHLQMGNEERALPYMREFYRQQHKRFPENDPNMTWMREKIDQIQEETSNISRFDEK